MKLPVDRDNLDATKPPHIAAFRSMDLKDYYAYFQKWVPRNQANLTTWRTLSSIDVEAIRKQFPTGAHDSAQQLSSLFATIQDNVDKLSNNRTYTFHSKQYVEDLKQKISNDIVVAYALTDHMLMAILQKIKGGLKPKEFTIVVPPADMMQYSNFLFTGYPHCDPSSIFMHANAKMRADHKANPSNQSIFNKIRSKAETHTHHNHNGSVHKNRLF